MGDRANVFVTSTDPSNGVYLYTHWKGSYLPAKLQDALRRGKSRWDDPPYLTRIIFCEMVQDEILDLTGHGISRTPCDGHDRILHVDCWNQWVRHGDKKWTFEGFVGLPDEELDKVWDD